MKEKLSDWASVAEIISAAAIVLSLIFVGFEIRNNTAAEYRSTYDQLLAATAEWSMNQSNNPDTVAAVDALLTSGAENLDPLTFRRAERAVVAIILIYERAYFARDRLGEQEWGRFERLMCKPDNIGQLGLKAGVSYGNFSEEFAEFLRQCDSE